MNSSNTKPSNKPGTSHHTAFTKLPVVDISRLFSGNIEDRRRVAHNLDRATREAGFFYLKGHGITPQLMADLKQVAATYFSQSQEQKMQDYIGLSQNHSGYVPQGEEQFYGGTVDLKEAYDIGFDSPSLMERFAPPESNNRWPKNHKAFQQDHKTFQPVVQAYYQAMLGLSRTLFKAFALALELEENWFSQNCNTPPSQLRLIHYFDNPDAKESDSGIGAHTDYEFFTILLPTAPGLEVLNGANQWINVPLLEDCFVINIGDMMQLASNERYVATSHRVRQVKQERYAFPFFASLDYHTVVEPITALKENKKNQDQNSLVCGDHLLAQTIQTFSYLKERLARDEITLPDDTRELASFGSHALRKK